jgi:hypothetical protein
MLILFGKNREPITLKVSPRRCEFVDQISPYVEETLAQELRGPFEKHLFDCPECLKGVQYGRLFKRSRLKSHNTSGSGKPHIPCKWRKS